MSYRENRGENLKKINGKVVTIVVMLLSLLLAGGLSLGDTNGGANDLTPGGSPEDIGG